MVGERKIIMGATSKKQTIPGPALPNIPWEDRPEGCRDVVLGSTL